MQIPKKCSGSFIPLPRCVHFTEYFPCDPIPVEFIGLDFKQEYHFTSGFITHIPGGLYHTPIPLVLFGF